MFDTTHGGKPLSVRCHKNTTSIGQHAAFSVVAPPSCRILDGGQGGQFCEALDAHIQRMSELHEFH